MQEVVNKFGRLDIAVNNAGIEIKKAFLEVTDAEWNKVIAVNLFGSYLVSQVAAQQMVRQGDGGKLIFISSVHEDIPFPEYTAYCASKGGVRMMMRNLAMELAQYKINVNNIARARSPRCQSRGAQRSGREEKCRERIWDASANLKRWLRWPCSGRRGSGVRYRRHLLC
jgi:NAD(P)-dependent dehydrogenase (short-subunit alcohol dehydrogenase family)